MLAESTADQQGLTAWQMPDEVVPAGGGDGALFIWQAQPSRFAESAGHGVDQAADGGDGHQAAPSAGGGLPGQGNGADKMGRPGDDHRLAKSPFMAVKRPRRQE